MSLKIENEWISATFKTFGAELTSLKKKGTDIEFLWQGDPTFWGRQAPVLFPFVGRLKDDTYTFQGKHYHMGQHGFARDKEFKVLEHTKETIIFCLKSDEETKAVYPFDFELQLRYELSEQELKVKYWVKNLGEGPMWYGIGGHPAFNVPFDEDGTFEDYYIRFSPMKSRLLLPLSGPFVDLANKTLGQTNTSVNFSRELFNQDALIFETPGKNAFSIQSDKTPHKITVSYENLPFVGIWSPYPLEAPFVCIEPWAGIADTLESTGELTEKFGMNAIESQEARIHEYVIEVE